MHILPVMLMEKWLEVKQPGISKFSFFCDVSTNYTVNKLQNIFEHIKPTFFPTNSTTTKMVVFLVFGFGSDSRILIILSKSTINWDTERYIISYERSWKILFIGKIVGNKDWSFNHQKPKILKLAVKHGMSLKKFFYSWHNINHWKVLEKCYSMIIFLATVVETVPTKTWNSPQKWYISMKTFY